MTNPLQLLQLAHRALPALVPLIPIDSTFLVYDLGMPGLLPSVQQSLPPLVAQLLIFLLPALVVATTYLSQKTMATPSADPSQQAMTRQMNLIMPMMFGLFSLQFASGLSIYFIVSNVVGAGQAWLMTRRWKKNPLLPAPEVAKSSKTSKPVAPKPDAAQADAIDKPAGSQKKALPAPKQAAGNTSKKK